MNYNLQKGDLEDLNTLIRIEESILETYQKLAELEKDGKKDTEEYRGVVNALKSSLNLENNIIEGLTDKSEKTLALLEYVDKNMNNFSSLDQIDMVTKRNQLNLAIIRIRSKLALSLINNHECLIDSNMPDYLKESLNTEDILDLKEYIGKNTKNYSELLVTIENDMNTFFLTILENFIKSPLYKNQRESITEAKYYLSYINPSSEKILLRENFSPSNSPYFTSDFVADVKGIDRDLLAVLKSRINSPILELQITGLLSIENYEYIYPEKNAEALLRELMIRTALQFLTDEEITATNQAFHELIEEPEYLSGRYDKSIDIITDAYKCYKKDKSSILRLSLKG